MKKIMNFLPVLAILAGMVLMSVTSGCKKDEKDDDPPAPKKYRMTSISQTDDGDQFLINITYNSSNKIARFSEIDNGVEVYRSDWNWVGNVVTIIESELDNGNWINGEYYEKLTYSGDHVTKSEYFQNDTLLSRSIYSWNGNLLASESREYYNADTLVASYTVNYIYNGDKLTSADYMTMGYLIQRQVIGYDNDKPVSLKTYDYQNVLEESAELIYTGNNITKVNSYNVVEGVQGSLDCTEDRIFDANNCVTTVNHSCPGDYSYTSIATWEEGSSNFNDFLLTQLSWITVYLFPDSYPSDLAYKKKK